MPLINTPTILLTDEQRRAENLLRAPQITFNNLISALQGNLNIVWGAPSPQKVLDALQAQQPGSPKELFDLNASLVEFLESHLPGSTASIVAMAKPYTVNGDGSITVTASAPAPTAASSPAAAS